MAEVAIMPVELEVFPENIPLPRSSMMTVRLSDIEDDASASYKDEVDITQSMSAPPSRPSSTRSSRASSQTSDSSTSINTVDWDELEKTEEQEPKDDASDEVRKEHDNRISCSQLISPTVHGIVAGPTREGERCFGN